MTRRKPNPEAPELDELRSLMQHSEINVPAHLRQATLQRLGLRRASRPSFARYALPVAALAGLALVLWQPALQQRALPEPRSERQPSTIEHAKPAVAQLRSLPLPRTEKKAALAAAPAVSAASDQSQPAPAAGAAAPEAPRSRSALVETGEKKDESTGPVLKLFKNVFKPAYGEHFTARVTLDSPAHLNALIYSAHGAVVARLHDRHEEAGEIELNWDGRDNDGLAVPSGAYTLVVRADQSLAKAHLLVVR